MHESVPQMAKLENGKKKNHTDVPTLPWKLTLKKKKSSKQICVYVQNCMSDC